jgi:hypothetical protein
MDLRTDMVPPILWPGNEAFTEDICARDLEFVQNSCSGAHVQSLEAESVSAEVVDDIAEPIRRREGVSDRKQKGVPLPNHHLSEGVA